jgi:hypothetical protein
MDDPCCGLQQALLVRFTAPFLDVRFFGALAHARMAIAEE